MEASDRNENLNERLARELEFSFVRSSGPGGQHANKVSSRVILVFDLTNSQELTDIQKETIRSKCSNRITAEGLFVLESQEERSQHRNKQIVIERFFDLITDALIPPKKRIPTKPTKASKIHRLEGKRKTAVKKDLRKPPNLD